VTLILKRASARRASGEWNDDVVLCFCSFSFSPIHSRNHFILSSHYTRCAPLPI